MPQESTPPQLAAPESSAHKPAGKTTATTLTGKVAFITGASSGIGAAMARAFATHGVRLALASRTSTDLGLPDCLPLKCDVRSQADVDRAVHAAVARFRRLDIVVANAGVGSWGPFEQTPAEEVQEMLDVNVRGTFNTVRAVLPLLRATGGGDLVIIASEAGRRGLPGEAAYVASKFAQVGFTRSLDHELRANNIRCCNICPGGVATNFGMGRGLRTPDMPELATMMRPEDVAEAVLYAVTRPRHYRILELAFRSMAEDSWG